MVGFIGKLFTRFFCQPSEVKPWAGWSVMEFLTPIDKHCHLLMTEIWWFNYPSLCHWKSPSILMVLQITGQYLLWGDYYAQPFERWPYSRVRVNSFIARAHCFLYFTKNLCMFQNFFKVKSKTFLSPNSCMWIWYLFDRASLI